MSNASLPSVVLNLNDYRPHSADSKSDKTAYSLDALKSYSVLPRKLDRVTIRTGYKADGTCLCCSPTKTENSDNRLAGELLHTHIAPSKINDLVIHYESPGGDESVSPIPAFLYCKLRSLIADRVVQTSGNKGSTDPSIFYMPSSVAGGRGVRRDTVPTKYTMGRTGDDDASLKHIEQMILEAISAGKQDTSSCFEIVSPFPPTLNLTISPEKVGNQKWVFDSHKLETFKATEQGKILTELQ